jgi:DNA-3-methyladenine glycosylase II
MPEPKQALRTFREIFSVDPQRPYSLALTAERFVRLPEIVDRFAGGVYRRLVAVDTGLALVTVRQIGSPARATLEVEVMRRGADAPASRAAAQRILHRVLGTGVEVRPFYRALRADPWLAEPIRRFRGLRVAGTPSLWEAIVTAVLSQQIQLSFAYSIRRELALELGRRARFDGETFVAFPAPRAIARVGERELRRFRLSRGKARALSAVAQAFLNGTFSEEEIAALDEEESVERLTSLPGVGRWTAEIALLRGLGRQDSFPAADLGVIAYLAQGLLGRKRRASETEMRAFAERWRPHRGLALVYAYAELARRKAAE